MTYLINLVLAVLCTFLLSGVNLASLHTLLHQHQDLHVMFIQHHHACSFASGLFISVTESRGGANTRLKQRVYAFIRSFALPGSPFLSKDARK